MLCLATAGAVTTLVASSFTLSWTHSVEKTQWRETWQVLDTALQPIEASVEGPGAGIDLPANAIWGEGRWTYVPRLHPVPEIILAASGMTASPWRLCLPDGSCRDLGVRAGEITRIWVADMCSLNRP
jgi:hypothetical protein